MGLERLEMTSDRGFIEPMPDSQTVEKPHEKPPWRGWQGYTRKRPRSLIPYHSVVGTKPLFVRAMGWLLPWGMRDYPGKQIGMVQALAGRYTLGTLLMWSKGRKPMSAIGALALADMIEMRLASGYALERELRAYAAERANRPKSGPGFRKVDPVTGMDGRPKIGRRRAKEV